MFAASSLHGAAREQYAAMEAGGGAVEAPPQKKGQLKDRPAAGRRGRKSVGYPHEISTAGKMRAADGSAADGSAAAADTKRVKKMGSLLPMLLRSSADSAPGETR